jgi:signal transduction histidine kinase
VQGEGTLHGEAEEAFFRVTQEALANVAKHSEANRAEVTLSYSADNVILEIRDDGHGFVLSAAEGQGMGLRSMRERIQALGGDLSVETAPGAGTRVTARCGPATVLTGGSRA